MSTTTNSNTTTADDDVEDIENLSLEEEEESPGKEITIEPRFFEKWILEKGLSPQQLASGLVLTLPTQGLKLIEFKFVGDMDQFAKNNNLSSFLKELLLLLVDDDDDDNESTTTTTTTKTLDFSGLAVNYFVENDKNKFMECLKIVGGANNTNLLQYIKIPAYSGCPFLPYGPPPSLIINILRNHSQTLKYLHLNYYAKVATVVEDSSVGIMNELIHSLKNNNNTTLKYFNSNDFKYYPETNKIVRYYLALNNVGRKEWIQHQTSTTTTTTTTTGISSDEFINTLSKIPKPEEFDTYDDRMETSTGQSTFLTYCMETLPEENNQNFYTSFVYEYLHYNLDIFAASSSTAAAAVGK